MTKVFYTGDTYNNNTGTGVMGRICDLLKYNGLQPNANDVNIGMTMLTGDAIFKNPVYHVSDRAPHVLNEDPTIENLLDIVKQLNGVGEIGNSMLGEYWSSRVAQAFFEHEQMNDINSMPEMELAHYDAVNGLEKSFKAIARHMKSYKLRKVNRCVSCVSLA